MKQTQYNVIVGRALLWGNLMLAILLVLGIFVCLEIITYNHSRALDLTPGKHYTLSEQTLKVLDSLDSTVTLTVFYKMGEREGHEAVLNMFAAASPKIKYQLIDLDRNPGKAKVRGASRDGDTFIAYKEKTSQIAPPNEQTIVNALLQLTQERQKVFYLTQGHGEKDAYKSLSKTLINENWKVEGLYLTERESVPTEDRTVVAIAGPEKDFLDHEIRLLDQYLQQGGKIVLMIEPFVKLPKLQEFLLRHQIRLSDDIIIDKENKLFGGDDLSPIVPYISRAPFTEGLRSALILPTARSIKIDEKLSFDSSVKPLASSAEYGWARAGAEGLKDKDPEFRENVDIPGPIPVAAWFTLVIKDGENKGKEGELICFGDSDFISDTFFDVLGNKDFFLNTVSWLGRESALISIRGTNFEYPYHFLDEAQGRLLFWVSVVILPAVFMVIGVTILLFRRVKG
jgi:ABC-type uncharacterized transport system involved in gliding motility auxiliary subunit